MKEFISKVKIIISWLKNFKKILFFREFFVFYLQKMTELNKLPEDKKYLASIPGIVGGYCSRHFMYFAPVYMESHVREIAREVFADNNSQELYCLIFLRNMYSSHYLSGWDKYYESEEVYLRRLSEIKSMIKDRVIFTGNFFITKTKTAENFSLHFTNGLSYILPINWFEISVFSFKLGLIYLENKYLNYLKDKDIIDVGAFVGDSSVVLSEYTNKKVIAIEPNKGNYEFLKKTISLNMLQDRVDAFNVVLDKEKRKVSIFDHGAGSRIVELKNKSDQVLISSTLDELVRGKYQKVGLIKMDVEGYELNILLGSKSVIEHDRPVLLISIYHSGEQFINLPLYLKEKYSNMYDFKFIDCNPVQPLSEKVLLCLPKSI